MTRILACRVLARELEHVLPETSLDYFEPLCHALSDAEFSDYVESLIRDHSILVCGDCGGLSEVARSKGIDITSSEDCIDLLLAGRSKEPGTLYLTDGWLEHLDVIFGLARLPQGAKEAVLGRILSPISEVVYIASEASGAKEEEARDLANALGCRFRSIKGSLEGISGALVKHK